MFDVIPRWALALGIGTISAASVGTLAFETLGSNSACVEANSAVLESNSCANDSTSTARGHSGSCSNALISDAKRNRLPKSV